jgi:hypothetical protein
MNFNNENYTKEKILFHGEKQQFQIHVIYSGNKAVLVVETLTTDQLLSLSSIPKCEKSFHHCLCGLLL